MPSKLWREDKVKIAILGAGSMGKWFARFAKERSWEISIYDINKKKGRKISKELGLEFSPNKEDAVENADVILISVPITETPKLIKEASESVKEGSLLIDIASVKERAVESMKEVKKRMELVSIHPLFGPGAKNLDNKNIISIPVEKGEKYQRLKSEFSELGAKIVEMEAEKHDKLMAVIQSLTHFSLLTHFSAFTSMDYSDEAEKFETPIFKNLFDLTKAFMYENPKLCADIQRENRYSEIARNSIIEASRNLNETLESGDIKKIEEIFDEAREKIGPEKIEAAYKKIYAKKGNEK